MQNLVVAVLVGGCFVYALWTLAPKAARSRLAKQLLKLPLPAMLQKPVQVASNLQGGCGCAGCDGPAAGQPKPVVIVRKR
jgi:hypothetical protein